MPPSDKRASTRFEVEVEMHVVAEGREATGRTLNLSLGGTLVLVPATPPLCVGERVRVSFRVPELAAPVTATADVRWVGDLDETLVGLQFATGFRAKETWALGRFLDKQKPL